MEDIIDIIVTETTNNIEITSQSTDEVIDVNIIDNREDITLNVTPTVVEININSLTGSFGVAWGDITGTLSAQTDLNTALGLKADLVGGKVPSSQLPSYVDDVVEVANYAALPATGETGKIYITLDTNYIYRWTGSTYVEIKDSSAVWGAITGTLSSQTDLQNALNAKFNNPTGDSTQYLNGAGTPVTFPVAGQSGTLVREVRNTTGATLTKGTIVYISGATGNKPTVSKAIATGDSTSAQTFGMCQADISNNSNGYVVCVGDITGLDTSAVSEGVQLYLSSTTAGTYTTTKQVAPAHLVYIGVVTRSHPTQGQIEVKIQNGYELDEIHDVLITSKANNDGLFYESSTSLWKNKSIATVLGYTPEQPLTFNSPLSRSTNTVSIPAATSSANGYLTSTDWSTFNGKQAALNGTGFVKASGTTISYDNSTYALDSAVVKLAGSQTITGQKTFSSTLYGTSGVFSGQISATTGNINGDNTTNALYITHNSSFNSLVIVQSGSGAAIYADGKILANQFVKIGGASTSFLKADGTVDNNTYLTTSSAASTYLPLSGGTLTGALSGTSASFSSNISAVGVKTNGGGNVSIVPTSYGGNGFIAFRNIADSATRWNIYNYTGGGTTYGSLNFSDGGGTDRLVINEGGAATFSSSVTANGTVTINGSNALYLNNTDNTTTSAILNGGASGVGVMQFYQGGSERMRLSSGNLGIGTTSPTTNVQIAGSNGVTDSYGQMFVSTTNSATADFGGQLTLGGYYNGTSNQTAFGAIAGRKENGTAGSALGYLAFSTQNGTITERMRITSGGELCVGTTSAFNAGLINMQANASVYNILTMRNTYSSQVGNYILFSGYTGITTGYIAQFNSNTVLYSTTSDYRLKEDLKPINGLDKLSKINVYDFKWKDSSDRADGVLAHELKEILPYAVLGNKDDVNKDGSIKIQAVDYSKIVPVMVQAIKDLKAELDTLKNK